MLHMKITFLQYHLKKEAKVKRVKLISQITPKFLKRQNNQEADFMTINIVVGYVNK